MKAVQVIHRPDAERPRLRYRLGRPALAGTRHVPRAALAGLVAALAALGTLVFAWLTVRGAQALRRDDRRARLLDLAADLAEAGRAALTTSEIATLNRVEIARHRLRAAINASGEPLPASIALLDVQWWPPGSDG
jgi:hypothetical protein